MRRGLFALGLGLWALGLSAQGWLGPATIGLEVLGKGKEPLAGAEVRLEYADIEPYAGPPVFSTDASGQAVHYRLAEGRWRLEIQHEGYSPYIAVVRLEAGSRPRLIAGPLRYADAPPMNVKLVKVEAPPASRRPERPAPPPAPAPPPVAPPSPSPPAAPSPSPTPTPAPVEPPPAAAPPELPPPSTPAPVEVQPPAAPIPVPAPVEPPPAAVPPPKPAPPAVPPVAPPPAPAPPPPATPPPVEVPVPAPPPPPRPSVPAVRSFDTGTCPDCKPGERAVSAEQAADARREGAGECPVGLGDEIEAALEPLGRVDGLAGFAGPLVDAGSGEVVPPAPSEVRAALGEALGTHVTPGAPCQVVAVFLPAGARFTGYAYDARDDLGAGGCLAGQDCQIGASDWVGHPRIEKLANGTVVFALFRNRSPERRRIGKLTVYFAPPK